MVIHLFPFRRPIWKNVFLFVKKGPDSFWHTHWWWYWVCNLSHSDLILFINLKSRPTVPSCAHIVNVWYVMILGMVLIWVFFVHNSNWRHMGSLMSTWRLREIHILMTITQMRMWGLLLALWVLSDPLQTSSSVQNVVYKEQLFLIDIAWVWLNVL